MLGKDKRFAALSGLWLGEKLLLVITIIEIS